MIILYFWTPMDAFWFPASTLESPHSFSQSVLVHRLTCSQASAKSCSCGSSCWYPFSEVVQTVTGPEHYPNLGFAVGVT